MNLRTFPFLPPQARRRTTALVVVLGSGAVLSHPAPGAGLPDPTVSAMVSKVKQSDLVNLVRQLSGDDPLMVEGNPFALTNRYTGATVASVSRARTMCE